MRKVAIVIMSLLLLTVLISGCLSWNEDEQTPTPDIPRYTEISFQGNVTGDTMFIMNGYLKVSAFNANHNTFDNVSMQLYREDGTLIASECYGKIEEDTRQNISYSHEEAPEYVLFTSPDFWEADLVDDSSILYFYQYGDGEYAAGRVFEQSEYPVDVARHSPCS